MDTERLIEILIQTNDKQAKTNNETLEVIKMINRQNCIRDCVVVLLVILGGVVMLKKVKKFFKKIKEWWEN